MGSLRICTYEDNHNPYIPRDELVDLAGTIYLQLRKYQYEGMFFEEYFEKYYNHEGVYKSWKK